MAARDLTLTEVDSLAKCGFVVLDNFLRSELARELSADARKHRVAFRPHEWIFAGLRLPKPGVSELDMHDEGAPKILPAFHTFWTQHMSRLIARLCEQAGLAHRSPDAPPTDGLSLKVQWNDGRGGSFPLHHDNAGPPSRRVLTIVVYLNEAWLHGHGGELVLCSFAGARVAVAPIMNRAVVFRSELVLHGVLPACAERCCFTIWVDDAAANAPADCALTRAHLRAGPHHDGTPAGLAAFFRASPLQRSIARGVYKEEMSRDLVRCLRAADGLDERRINAVVGVHESAAAAQRGNPELRAAVELLVRAKLEAQASELSRGADEQPSDYEVYIA
jgi:hypothetical protein